MTTGGIQSWMCMRLQLRWQICQAMDIIQCIINKYYIFWWVAQEMIQYTRIWEEKMSKTSKLWSTRQGREVWELFTGIDSSSCRFPFTEFFDSSCYGPHIWELCPWCNSSLPLLYLPPLYVILARNGNTSTSQHTTCPTPSTATGWQCPTSCPTHISSNRKWHAQSDQVPQKWWS